MSSNILSTHPVELSFTLANANRVTLTLTNDVTGKLGVVTITGKVGPGRYQLTTLFDGHTLGKGRYTLTVQSSSGDAHSKPVSVMLSVR